MFYQQFPITSRYHNIETATLETEDERLIVYLRRRFLPNPNQFALLQEHRVTADQRPDHLAALYLNDPEQFWRLADANGVMQPDELTEEIGRTVRITLPEGIPSSQE
jgi:predicted signal transduction protein with EAL and GGDEF domain